MSVDLVGQFSRYMAAMELSNGDINSKSRDELLEMWTDMQKKSGKGDATERAAAAIRDRILFLEGGLYRDVDEEAADLIARTILVFNATPAN